MGNFCKMSMVMATNALERKLLIGQLLHMDLIIYLEFDCLEKAFFYFLHKSEHKRTCLILV